ncbi:calcium-responsive transcription factor [Eublepharis macularius]|uniref:Calcium-responsive transcription factor n=1 Tax=Eublepharis macularius TaxID=481883 RepID=A0AA97IY98_EUBMA|nr:calcium-responsive transcription factor [Eublepharis macularius]
MKNLVIKACTAMEENGVDCDNSIERASDFLVVSSNNVEELESSGQVFQCLVCMKSKNMSFGQNVSHGGLPTVDNASPSLNAQVQRCQPPSFQVEDFQLVDQNSHSLYEVQSLEGSSSSHMVIVAHNSENEQVLHVVPSTQQGTEQVIIPQGQLLDVCSSGDVSQEKSCDGNLQTVAVAAIADNTNNYVFHPQASLTVSKKIATRVLEDSVPVPPQPLPPSAPVWARRLSSCEKIGDSYRGYCSSETELESVLTLHKQQTQSVWGTRQSPSPAKPATRLMWKSQYVPYDGIPFVNAGSRAIVMECQYGPRRKGFQPRRSSDQESVSRQLYKATCPARIYIKKVQKFPEYRVPTDPKIDKKVIRMEQEKAFNMLKKNLIDVGGVFRWYVQLPTKQAHQYHEMEEVCLPLSPFPVPSPEEDDNAVGDENCILPSRLHPQVAEKIRELVSQGIQQVYAVRKQLRKFVEQELFKPDQVPQRHNLSFFPTVNDIKNHIHEVQKTLKNGKAVYNSEIVPAMLQWTADGGNILTETVTVTFASPLTEGSSREKTIIKVESNQTRELFCPEVTQLLSSLHPRMFAQIKGLQMQPSLTSITGTATLVTVDSYSPPSSSGLLYSTERLSESVISPGCALQDNATQTQNNTIASLLGDQPEPDQKDCLITAESTEDAEAIEQEVHQIPLRDACTIADHHPALKNPRRTAGTDHVGHETKEQAVSSELEQFRDFQASSVT